MRTPGADLLLDLAVLIQRHPAGEWVKLARMLESERSRSQIVSFLRDLSVLGDRVYKSNSASELHHKVTGKAKKISKNKTDYGEKIELQLARSPTVEIKHLAVRAGLQVSPKDSKKRVIQRILRSPDLMSVIRKKGVFSASVSKADEYGRWARIILGKTDQNAD
jgi:hypothetical protein